MSVDDLFIRILSAGRVYRCDRCGARTTHLTSMPKGLIGVWYLCGRCVRLLRKASRIKVI